MPVLPSCPARGAWVEIYSDYKKAFNKLVVPRKGRVG